MESIVETVEMDVKSVNGLTQVLSAPNVKMVYSSGIPLRAGIGFHLITRKLMN
jgi:hypothetical protein